MGEDKEERGVEGTGEVEVMGGGGGGEGGGGWRWGGQTKPWRKAEGVTMNIETIQLSKHKETITEASQEWWPEEVNQSEGRSGSE
jgi:hypothetical protein